jgi:hypothetical protein
MNQPKEGGRLSGSKQNRLITKSRISLENSEDFGRRVFGAVFLVELFGQSERARHVLVAWIMRGFNANLWDKRNLMNGLETRVWIESAEG